MAKVTSKLQVTIPKSIASQYGIRPGADIEWAPAGDDAVRVVVARTTRRAHEDVEFRLRLFDEATRRQRRRQGSGRPLGRTRTRGWRREELYERAVPG